jgi:hypothetical protein
MESIPFILRARREQLWRRWAELLVDRAPGDFADIMGSPVGERCVRAFLEDLVAWSEAEQYEAPVHLRQACDRVASETAARVSLGFTAMDMVVALQTMRPAVIDVLLDALVVGELPSLGATLEAVKAVDGFIDDLVFAILRTELSQDLD